MPFRRVGVSTSSFQGARWSVTRWVLGAVLLGLTGRLPAAVAPAVPFPHVGCDLAPDPAARFGQLDNGLQYVLVPNGEPPGRVSLRLLVRAGSRHEDDDQSGQAHYLEHMAFRGSSQFPSGTLIGFFQRMGMSFGADSNANTSFDRTLYALELPDARHATVTEGLRVLADYGGGLQLEPAAFEIERGVVLREWRARDTAEARTDRARAAAMLAGTRWAERAPLGSWEGVRRARREQLSRFRDDWYRPERMVVLAVGAIEPDSVERQIAAAFAGLVPRAPARPEPGLGTVETFSGVRPVLHVEPESAAATVSIVCLTPPPPAADGTRERLARLPRQLAFAMLGSRLKGLGRLANSPITEVDAGFVTQTGVCGEAAIEIVCDPERWPAALVLGEQQLRAALDRGFQPVELAMAVEACRRTLEQAADGAGTRRSAVLAENLARSLVQNEVLLAPRAEADLLRPALERVTEAECRTALRDAFRGNGLYVMLSGNFRSNGDPAKAILGVYTASAKTPLRFRRSQPPPRWAYGAKDTPGAVVRREHVPDLDVTLVTFANGVRLNVKPTPFEAGRIRLLARVGDGALTEPPGQRGLARLASEVLVPGGLRRHSVVEYSRALAGHAVDLQFSAHSLDALTFRGTTTPADTPLMLELLTAQIAEPGFREEAVGRAARNFLRMYNGLARSVEGPLSIEVANLLASGDPRFGLPPMGEMWRRDFGEVRAWLKPQLAHGAIELGIVGDVDVESAIAAVARTLGRLPQRAPRRVPEEPRRLSFPSRPFEAEFAVGSTTTDGRAMVYWPTSDGLDARREQRLGLLASVLQERLREELRDNLGLTYSPRVRSITSDLFPGYGYLVAAADADPARVGEVVERIVASAARLAEGGVSADGLDRARLPALTAVRESLRSNQFWLSAALACAQERPEALARMRVIEADLANCSREDLSALATAFLAASRASRVTLVPNPAGVEETGLR